MQSVHGFLKFINEHEALGGNHAYKLITINPAIVLFLAFFGKLDKPVFKSKKGEVLADPHIVAREIFIAFLAHQNITGCHQLPGIKFDAKAFAC